MKLAMRVVIAVSVIHASLVFAEPRLHPALVADLNNAKLNQSTAQMLWSKNLDACLTRDDQLLVKIQQSANQQLHSRGSPSATSFPSCALMLTDVVYFNGGCYTGKFSQMELDRVRANWDRDNRDCEKQIATTAEPEVQISEIDWEADQRKKGATDSDIEMMKALRGL